MKPSEAIRKGCLTTLPLRGQNLKEEYGEKFACVLGAAVVGAKGWERAMKIYYTRDLAKVFPDLNRLLPPHGIYNCPVPIWVEMTYRNDNLNQGRGEIATWLEGHGL